jgi:hypothetical protein
MTDADSSMPFTLVEEEFFRAGAAIEAGEPVETFSDLEQARRPTFWQRLFGRRR